MNITQQYEQAEAAVRAAIKKTKDLLIGATNFILTEEQEQVLQEEREAKEIRDYFRQFILGQR